MKSRKQAGRLGIFAVAAGSLGASLVTYNSLPTGTQSSVFFVIFCWIIVVSLTAIMPLIIKKIPANKEEAVEDKDGIWPPVPNFSKDKE